MDDISTCDGQAYSKSTRMLLAFNAQFNSVPSDDITVFRSNLFVSAVTKFALFVPCNLLQGVQNRAKSFSGFRRMNPCLRLLDCMSF